MVGEAGRDQTSQGLLRQAEEVAGSRRKLGVEVDHCHLTRGPDWRVGWKVSESCRGLQGTWGCQANAVLAPAPGLGRRGAAP